MLEGYYDLAVTEILLSYSSMPQIKKSKNSKDAVVMSEPDYLAFGAIKVEYLKHCFSAAKVDLTKGHIVDGEDFLQAL